MIRYRMTRKTRMIRSITMPSGVATVRCRFGNGLSAEIPLRFYRYDSIATELFTEHLVYSNKIRIKLAKTAESYDS